MEDKSKKYHFLHSHVSKEPHIYEVLDEIDRIQKEFTLTTEGTLATLEELRKTKNIKFPFTPARDKNIFHLVTLLRKNYPDEIKTVITYFFNTDTATKKLSLKERIEFTVLLSNSEVIKFQNLRDGESIESLLELVSKYRFFNLTKLQKFSKEKTHLAQLITSEIGINIFTFKHHTLDSNNLETIEDFCFHKDNYEAVIKSLNIQNVQKIISTHNKHIITRLKKFGILSTTFNDYRDNKLDYLLNILLDDISSFLGDKDLIEVKNFNNLRKCLQNFDQVVDPIITVSNDLIKHIRENEIVKKSELVELFDSLPRESIVAWAAENSEKYEIVSHDDGGETYYIDISILFPRTVDLNNQILNKKEHFAQLGHSEKQKKFTNFKILCNTSRKILNSPEVALKVFNSDENIDKMKKIVKDFDDYQKKVSIKSEVVKEKPFNNKEKTSLIGIVLDAIKSLFGIGSSKTSRKKRSSGYGSHEHGGQRRTRVSNDSKEIYNKIIRKNAPLIAMSNYLDITSENDITIDSVINELREKNKKIVIPIYNARDVLYPNRSQQFLISDMEYLMVDPDVTKTGDTIRAFTDSLRGQKLKNEQIPSSAIISIEKYLLTLFRQKKKRKKP